MTRKNGGIIGQDISTNVLSAGGFWSLQQAYNKTLGSAWPLSPFDVEFLIVAGGAGGGNTHAGGGGAGGYVSAITGELSGAGSASLPLQQVAIGDTFSIVVGAGGAAGTGRPTNGFNGGDSSVFGYIAVGGGGGGSEYKVGVAGGSGGGGASRTTTRAAGTANQGYDGGYHGDAVSNFAGGGGGGAGQLGQIAVDCHPYAGHGGNGQASSITGSVTYYAGGGGGGCYGGYGGFTTGGNGGSGGGGRGNNGSGNGLAGTTNTGGGGGGGGYGDGTAYAGGSGVVILRYPDSKPAASATTGSPTITVSGGYRIYTFTTSGSITF